LSRNVEKGLEEMPRRRDPAWLCQTVCYCLGAFLIAGIVYASHTRHDMLF